jgi:hypothetical protein
VYREREKAVIAEGLSRLRGLRGDEARAALQGVARCVNIQRPMDELDVLTVTLEAGEDGYLRYDDFGILFWRHGEEWRASSLLMDPVGANGLRVRWALPRASGGYEVIINADIDGTGRIGDFRLYALESEMRLLWQSPGGGRYTGRLLALDLLLEHYRAPRVFDEPHYTDANCCLPNNGQTLWQRQGDTFVEVASRLHPSIHYTVSAFLGALSSGKPELAAAYATGPAVVAAFQDPRIDLGNVPDVVNLIDQTEAEHWDALPAKFNRPAPQLTEFIWPAKPRSILLRRIEGEWKVAGWADPARVTTPICEVAPGGDFPLRFIAARQQENLLITVGLPRLRGLNADQAAATLQAVADCLTVERQPGLDVLTVKPKDGLQRLGRYGMFGMLLWRDREEWRAASLLTDRVGNGLLIKWVQPRATGGYEAILTADLDGTGHFGNIQLYALASEMKLLWESPHYDHFWGTVLAPDWVLADYRDPRVWKEPHLFWGNCCMPENGQTLWQRQGDSFVEKDSRISPSLYYTVSAFGGALRAGRSDLAAAYATGPDVVADLEGVKVGGTPEAVQQIDQAEARHWDAFPPELNGPVPQQTEFIWPATPRPILLRRINGEWKVAGWAN